MCIEKQLTPKVLIMAVINFFETYNCQSHDFVNLRIFQNLPFMGHRSCCINGNFFPDIDGFHRWSNVVFLAFLSI